jgi:valyl-tRNA synthetase
MPFVTEEIWQRFDAGDSLVIADWPEPHPEHLDEDADRFFASWTEAMEAARSSLPAIEKGIAYRAELDPRDRGLAEEQAELAGAVTRTRVLILDQDGLAVQFERDPQRTAAHGEDPEAFRRRQRKRLDDIRRKVAREEEKLANERFLRKAAPEAVERARRKLEDLRKEEAKLGDQLSVLEQRG